MPSQDGKGRTLWEILSGRNKRDLTPLELQYHNPLGARVGNTVSFDNEPELKGINFVIEKLSVYETKVKARKFYHTDYHLKGLSLGMEKPLRFRLRLIPDEDETNKLGSKIQLLNLYDSAEWDEGLFGALNSDSGEFWVQQDDNGVALAEPRKYWRIDDVLDPYKARVTILADKDGDGKIDDHELERADVTYWDYHRDTTNPDNGLEYREYLTVEMNDTSRYFTFLRGRYVESSQIMVI